LRNGSKVTDIGHTRANKDFVNFGIGRNQARVKDNATVVSTSTRNFPNRLGDDADVYLSSAEVAAIAK
jgi:aconitase B